jgi:hypothetical protein
MKCVVHIQGGRNGVASIGIEFSAICLYLYTTPPQGAKLKAPLPLRGFGGAERGARSAAGFVPQHATPLSAMEDGRSQ